MYALICLYAYKPFPSLSKYPVSQHETGCKSTLQNTTQPLNTIQYTEVREGGTEWGKDILKKKKTTAAQDKHVGLCRRLRCTHETSRLGRCKYCTANSFYKGAFPIHKMSISPQGGSKSVLHAWLHRCDIFKDDFHLDKLVRKLVRKSRAFWHIFICLRFRGKIRDLRLVFLKEVFMFTPHFSIEHYACMKS